MRARTPRDVAGAGKKKGARAKWHERSCPYWFASSLRAVRFLRSCKPTSVTFAEVPVVDARHPYLLTARRANFGRMLDTSKSDAAERAR